MMSDEELKALITSKLSSDELSTSGKRELLSLIRKQKEYRRFNKVKYFYPYPFQSTFFEAGATYRFRFLCAANRIGKTFSQASEMYYHLSGTYPDWWQGRRFTRPISAWAIGITGESTRDVLQKELLGTNNARDAQAIGSGSIPKTEINFNTLERDGGRVLRVHVKHYNKAGKFDGYSELAFKSTQQGEQVLMGTAQDYIWLDEEDPFNSWDIFEQCLTRTATTKGSVVITATPENGKTQLVAAFMDAKGDGLYFQKAGVMDAPHFTPELIKEQMQGIAPHKRAMRLYGEPLMGSGAVYDVDFDKVIIDAFEIPKHWKVICAMDIGYSHNTAAIFSAYDADNDIIYITSEYGGSGLTAANHASAIRKRDKNIAVILPKDAWQHEKGSGIASYDIYREEGLNVLSEPFYNKLTVEGKKDFSVEYGIEEIRSRMLEGRLKIFNNCTELLKELRDYHRKDGKIVKEKDDYADAMRYSALSVTHRGRPATGTQYSSAYEVNLKAWRV